MAELQAFLPGIYPRSEALVQATRDLDRGRTTLSEVDEQVERDLAELVSAQQAAGLDLLTDGMLRWQDHFRPLLEAAEGLETGALTRFLDTNTFYRAPQGSGGEATLEAGLDERFVAPLPGARLLTFPSPFALAAGTGLSPQVLAEGVLKPVVESAEADLVVLVEPFLAREDDASLEGLGEALDTLGGGPELALWLTFGDAGRVLAQGAADLPVDALGVDFYATTPAAIPDGFPKQLLAGVIDARSSTLDEPREIAAFVEELRARGVERIALVPNGDLQYVSEPIAREKLSRLGKARTATVEAAA